MPDNVKPSMSMAGWVYAGGPKLDELIDDFYCSEYSQTYLYRGEVCSLQWIVQRNIHDPIALCADIKTRLEKYLQRYFTSATVSAMWYNQNTNDAKAALKLSVDVVDSSGATYNFSDLRDIVDSKAMRTIDANNGE
jgi:hypothetical protein